MSQETSIRRVKLRQEASGRSVRRSEETKLEEAFLQVATLTRYAVSQRIVAAESYNHPPGDSVMRVGGRPDRR